MNSKIAMNGVLSIISWSIVISVEATNPEMTEFRPIRSVSNVIHFFALISGDGSLIPVDMSPDCTLRHVTELLVGSFDDDDVVFNIGRHSYKGRGLDTLIADSGVTAEAVVEINESPLKGLSDIGLLFHIFENPGHTQDAFGFAHYGDFKRALQADDGSAQMFLKKHIGDQVRIHYTDGLIDTLRVDWIGNEECSGINWDAVYRMKGLRCLQITGSGITGVVPFDHLSPMLQELYLRNNRLSGVQKPQDCPLTLDKLDLKHNPFVPALQIEDFPRKYRFEIRHQIKTMPGSGIQSGIGLI